MACEDFAREALEPLAKLPLGAEVYDDVDLVLYQNAGRAITVGDVRRARTACDAIGSGVKTDSGWIEWAGGETPVEPGTEGLLRVEDGEVIYTKQLGSFNFAHDRSGPFPGRRIIAYRALSTHTAAGAGPVGEAVAWRCWARGGHCGVTDNSIVAAEWERLGRVVTPLYARPVEESGEVERLTRERDALAEALEQINSTSLSEVFDGRIGKIVSAAREVLAERFDFNAHSLKVNLARETKRAETAEDALAETRERLEKVEAALRRSAQGWDNALELGLLPEQHRKTAIDLRDIARAALTGDAHEAKAQQRSYPGNRTREEWEIVAQASAARAAHLPED